MNISILTILLNSDHTIRAKRIAETTEIVYTDTASQTDKHHSR